MRGVDRTLTRILRPTLSRPSRTSGFSKLGPRIVRMPSGPIYVPDLEVEFRFVRGVHASAAEAFSPVVLTNPLHVFVAEGKHLVQIDFANREMPQY